MRLRIVMVVGLIGLATIPFLLRSNDNPEHVASEAGVEGVAPGQVPGSAAMRAYIDPETGTLTSESIAPEKSSDEHSAELEAMLSRESDGLVEVHHPDGSVSVHLQGRFQSASMAHIDSSGKLHTACVNTTDAAHAHCKGQQTTSQTVEEK